MIKKLKYKWIVVPMDYSIKHVSLSINDRHNGLSMSDTIITFDLHINATVYHGVRLWANRIFGNKIHLTLMGHSELDMYLKSLKRNISRQLVNELRHREDFIRLADDYFCHHILGQTEFQPSQMTMEM
jgi:hypothetical protein